MIEDNLDFDVVYIYGLIDPRNRNIRYIGKTVNPEIRFSQHINDKTSNPGKIIWIEELEGLGLQPEMVILEYTDEDNWPLREIWWIEFGNEVGWELLNMTPGGDGGLYHIPICIKNILSKSAYKKFNNLSNLEQANGIIAAAEDCSTLFMKMAQCISNNDTVGARRCRKKASKLVAERLLSLC